MHQGHGPKAICFSLFSFNGLPGTSPQGFLPGEQQITERSAGKRTRALLLGLFLACIAGMMAGKAGATGTLSFSPTGANFGSVQVGTSKSISVTITNTGTASVSISKESLQANDYAVSGLALPATLAPGGHITVTVKFTPLATGAIDGRIVFASNATNSLVYYSLTGTGVAGGLVITPSVASFGNVPIGVTNSQTEQLKNSGSTAITISGATLTGSSQFKMCNWSYPFTLAAGSQVNCPLSFTAASVGSFTGAVTFSSSKGTVSVPMTAAGLDATSALSALSSSLNFGNVTVGKSETLAVKLENAGNSSLTVSGITSSAADIKTSGGLSGATIAPGQTATLDVTFAPTETETISGSVTVTSSAANSPAKIAVSGAGVAGLTYSVSLSWTASVSSGVAGYNVYRAMLPGTAYSKITSTLISGTTHVDSSVAAGESYSYEVTTVNTQGAESAPSAPVTATIP